MDPSRELCQIHDSFSQEVISIAQLQPFVLIENGLIDVITENITTASNTSVKNLPAIHVDTKLYADVQKIKDEFDNTKNFRQARNQANPFEYLGKAQFQDRAAMKLANVDAVFKLTGSRISYLQPIDFDNTSTFVDLAGGPGAFVEYLQYRWPKANGFGITLRHPNGDNLEWNFKSIRLCNNNNRGGFTPLYGADDTGNLYTNAESFAQQVLTKVIGVELVTADGGIDVDTTNDYYRQEFLNMRLIISQIYAAILILKDGGNFVLKVFDTVTDMSAQTLFIVSCLFEKLYIFKPVASRPANSERYVVAMGFRKHDFYINLLKSVYHKYTDMANVVNIFNTDSVPVWSTFHEWLTKMNDLHLTLQYQTGEHIIKLMTKQPVTPLPKYDLSKCLIMWNLADNNNSQIKYKFC